MVIKAKIITFIQNFARNDNDHNHFALTKDKIGGPHSTMDSVLASHLAAPGSILGVPKDLFLTEI